MESWISPLIEFGFADMVMVKVLLWENFGM